MLRCIIRATTAIVVLVSSAAMADDLEGLARSYRDRYPASRTLTPVARCTSYCTASSLDAIKIFPPPEYDHPYQGDVQVYYLSLPKLKEKCPPNKFGQYLACAYPNFPKKGHCVIWMGPAEVLEAAGYSDTVALRHETAHCGGWPADHPGIRALSEPK